MIFGNRSYTGGFRRIIWVARELLALGCSLHFPVGFHNLACVSVWFFFVGFHFGIRQESTKSPSPASHALRRPVLLTLPPPHEPSCLPAYQSICQRCRDRHGGLIERGRVGGWGYPQARNAARSSLRGFKWRWGSCALSVSRFGFSGFRFVHRAIRPSPHLGQSAHH